MIEALLASLAAATVCGVAVWKNMTRKQERLLRGVQRAHEEELGKVRHQFAKELFEAKASHEQAFSRLSADLAFRETEVEALTFADRLIHRAETRQQLCRALQETVESKFSNEVKFFVAWSIVDEPQRLFAGSEVASENRAYLDCAQRNFITTDIFESGNPAVFPAKDLEAVPAELNLANDTLVYLPLMAHDRRFGLLCAFFNGSSYNLQLRVLRQVIDKFCHALYLITRIEEEYRSARIDPLTGLPNRLAIYDMLPQMVASADERSSVAALIIEADNLDAMNEKYGHVVMDEVLQHLSGVIQCSARVEGLNGARPEDKYVRYDSAQFLMLSKDIDGMQALAVAQRIRDAVESKEEWPGGVPCLSVSIGIALDPDDASEGNDLLAKAEVALLYLKEHDDRNSAIRFDQVPRHFRISKLSGGAVSGSLAAFDPASTLQSVARAQKTGILTVTNESGSMFWGFINHGTLEKAYLDQFCADLAVVQFLATFSDGNFAFREYDLLDAEALEYIHQLDATYDCKKTLDRNLMDGALAQDQLAEAHRLLPNTRLFVKPTLKFREFVASLPTMSQVLSPSEIEAMQAICKYVNGRTMLSVIIDKLHTFPTHLRWHAAALLIRHEAVELTQLALSFTL